MATGNLKEMSQTNAKRSSLLPVVLKCGKVITAITVITAIRGLGHYSPPVFPKSSVNWKVVGTSCIFDFARVTAK